jgi:hypothetical protein
MTDVLNEFYSVSTFLLCVMEIVMLYMVKYGEI